MKQGEMRRRRRQAAHRRRRIIFNNDGDHALHFLGEGADIASVSLNDQPQSGRANIRMQASAELYGSSSNVVW